MGIIPSTLHDADAYAKPQGARRSVSGPLVLPQEHCRQTTEWKLQAAAQPHSLQLPPLSLSTISNHSAARAPSQVWCVHSLSLGRQGIFPPFCHSGLALRLGTAFHPPTEYGSASSLSTPSNDSWTQLELQASSARRVPCYRYLDSRAYEEMSIRTHR